MVALSFAAEFLNTFSSSYYSSKPPRNTNERVGVHSNRVGWRLVLTIPPDAKLFLLLALSLATYAAFLFLRPYVILLASCTLSSSRETYMRSLAFAADLAFQIFMSRRTL
jgi:hypothetical protein